MSIGNLALPMVPEFCPLSFEIAGLIKLAGVIGVPVRKAYRRPWSPLRLPPPFRSRRERCCLEPAYAAWRFFSVSAAVRVHLRDRRGRRAMPR
jgi:hypothetical protein